MSNDSGFIPPRFLRGAYTQTVLASARIRAVGRNPMREAACEMVIDAGGGSGSKGFSQPNAQDLPLAW